jgi:hydrogenase maturation factor
VLAAIVASDAAPQVLDAMRTRETGRSACVAGRVARRGEPRLLVMTGFGTTRVVGPLPGALLPRIC